MKKHHQTSRQDLKNSIKVGRTRRHGGGRPSVEDEREGGRRVVVWKTVTARVTKLSKLNLGHLNDQKYIRPGGM